MDRSPPPFFKQGPSANARLVFFSILAIVLIVVDARMGVLAPLRQGGGTLLYPVQRVLLWPRDTIATIREYTTDVGRIRAENAELRRIEAVNARALLQAEQLASENAQLRKLVDMRERLAIRSAVAEVLYETRDPFIRHLVLDKGLQHGVLPGQPVIDPGGVVGQITRVTEFSAELTLLTDRQSTIPVSVRRTARDLRARRPLPPGPAGRASHRLRPGSPQFVLARHHRADRRHRAQSPAAGAAARSRRPARDPGGTHHAPAQPPARIGHDGPMLTRPEYLLLPANRVFITASIVVALLLNMLPWARMHAIPDFLALVLVFWNIHQPRLVGIGIAFVFGLVQDVHDASLFGEHALAYTLLSYGAISLHRRVLWFKPMGQMVYVLPLFLLAQLVTLVLRLMMGAGFPGWTFFLQSFSSTLLWPLAEFMLLAPQRRARNRDENRPL